MNVEKNAEDLRNKDYHYKSSIDLRKNKQGVGMYSN